MLTSLFALFTTLSLLVTVPYVVLETLPCPVLVRAPPFLASSLLWSSRAEYQTSRRRIAKHLRVLSLLSIAISEEFFLRALLSELLLLPQLPVPKFGDLRWSLCSN